MVSAHLSEGSLVRGSFIRGLGFTCPEVQLFGGSLVRTLRLLHFRVLVRHSQGAPLDSISEHFSPPPYPFSQIPTRIALHVNENNSCASLEAGFTKRIL